MGRLVADAGKRDWDELTAEYGAMLMEGLGVMGTCIIRPMSTVDSDGCRPLVPSHADHLFRQHGVHFFGNTGIGGRHCSDSVDSMLRNLGEHH